MHHNSEVNKALIHLIEIVKYLFLEEENNILALENTIN